MHKKLTFISACVALSALCFVWPASYAQTATAPASAPASGSTPAKKALAARILKVQQPVIEGVSRAMVERPAQAIMEKAGVALTNSVAADKREAAAKDIEGYVKKYLDEALPLVASRALKLAPTTVGALLEEKFSEDDLKQLATFLESPAYNKYQQLGGDMQKALMEKLLAETRATIEPKVVALDQAVGKRLAATGAAGPGAPAK